MKNSLSIASFCLSAVSFITYFFLVSYTEPLIDSLGEGAILVGGFLLLPWFFLELGALILGIIALVSAHRSGLDKRLPILGLVLVLAPFIAQIFGF